MFQRPAFWFALCLTALAALSCSFDLTSRNALQVTANSGGSNPNGTVSSSGSGSSSGTTTTGGAATSTSGTTSAGATTTSGGGGTTTGDTTSAAHWFPSTFFVNQSVRNAAVDSQSSTILSALAANGGWGNSNRFQIDFSIDVYYTDNTSVSLPFQDQGIYLPDSDVPTSVPVPPGGSDTGFESSSGLTCDGGDCHYLVVDRTNQKLIEVDEAQVASGQFQSWGSVAIWDFQHTYGASLRGDVCTSADAGGLPIASTIFSAEEVAAGTINHAIRLILPNSRIQCRTYVRPATHTTGPSNCSGWATTNGVPYGAHFRLKPTYDPSTLPNAGARVVAAALQEYGMILSDGGQIALTAKSDKNSVTKWDSLLGSTDLHALQVTDFEMVDGGTRFHPSSLDCVRTP